MKYDLQIRNTLIYDGTGKDACLSNVTVNNGKIIYIGEEIHSAKKVVDADGLCLSPGFIDVHSHSDNDIINNPNRMHVLKMGVTTEIAGQCGSSITPVGEGMTEEEGKSVTVGNVNFFANMQEFLNELECLELGTNQHYFTGHGLLRRGVLGTSANKASDAQIEVMQKSLASEMQMGSAGVSTGLSYVPGIYSDTHELIMLAKTAAENGGIYTTHSRSESMGLFDNVRECIEISRQANAPVNISHFKCVGKVFWERCEKALSMLDEAIKDGCDITLDAYPYTAVSTTTLSVIPPQFLSVGREAFTKSLYDESVVNNIKREIFEVNDPSWDNSMYYVGLENFLVVIAPNTPWAIGKTYVEIAKELGVEPFEAVIHLLKENNSEVKECRFGMCEENVEMILKHPRCMVGSDGIFKKRDTLAHPRAFGTFPRYLGHYIRDRKILSREEGIKRITGMPAQRYGLITKGRIDVGYDADLVLFDYDNICDHADFTDPFKPNEGIYQVYMNGDLVLENNESANVFNGKYIYKNRR